MREWQSSARHKKNRYTHNSNTEGEGLEFGIAPYKDRLDFCIKVVSQLLKELLRVHVVLPLHTVVDAVGEGG